MKFDGALITERGVTFAIAIVKPSALTSSDRESIRNSYIPIFGNIPIVLASQDSTGRIKYHGRQDIVNFLAKLHPSQIPWKTYTVN